MNFITEDHSTEKWILIRGLTRGAFHWFDFPEKLSSALQKPVLTLDIPGNGELSQQKFPDSLDDCVEFLRQQIPNRSKINLLGISLGGMIATKWATLYPDEIQNLVLISSSFSNSAFYERLRPQNYGSIAKLMLRSNPEQIEEFILSATSNSDHWKNRLQSNIHFHKKYPIQFQNLIKQLWVASQAQIPPKPIEKCTVLIGQGDRFVHPRCSLEIAKKWNISPQIHPTAGHDLPLDAPEWIIEQIKKLSS